MIYALPENNFKTIYYEPGTIKLQTPVKQMKQNVHYEGRHHGYVIPASNPYDTHHPKKLKNHTIGEPPFHSVNMLPH